MYENQVSEASVRQRTSDMEVGQVLKSLINSLNLMPPNGAKVHQQKNTLTAVYGLQMRMEEAGLLAKKPDDLEETNKDLHEQFLGLTAKALSFGANL